MNILDIGGINISSLDYILIVDKEYNIVFNTRYDPRTNIPEEQYHRTYYRNKNLFEVYPNLEKHTSSIVECINTGEVVIKKHQTYSDFKHKIFITHNITIPIIRKSQIVGAVELVKDITTVEHVEMTNCEQEFDVVAERIKNKTKVITFDHILTKNYDMIKAIERAKFLSKLPNPTLIYGETGTGKELFAQSMIQYSGVSKSKVIIQNCAAVPEGLIESTLFGTIKGAYTGAENKKGLFEEADGGILFLDEINSLPFTVQGKLLRVLQDGSFRAVGSNIEKTANVKIIAAMNVDPMEAIEIKQFREDLFYRFSSGLIRLIPLKERKEDIPLYIQHFIKEFNIIYTKNVQGIEPDLMELFFKFEWRGNVRELRHIVEAMVGSTDKKTLCIQDLPAYLYHKINQIQKKGHPLEGDIEDTSIEAIDMEPLEYALARVEKTLIQEAMKIANQNKTKAAELLRIPRQTLNYKIRKYFDISKEV